MVVDKGDIGGEGTTGACVPDDCAAGAVNTRGLGEL